MYGSSPGSPSPSKISVISRRLPLLRRVEELRRALDGGDEGAELLRDLAGAGLAVGGAAGLGVVGAERGEARGLRLVEAAEELPEAQLVELGAAREELGLEPVVVLDQRRELLVVHDRGDLLRDLVHAAV